MADTADRTGAMLGSEAPMEEEERGSVAQVLTLLRPPRARRQAVAYGVAVLGTMALTLAFLPIRDDIAPLAKGFGFLIVVVASAAVGGIGPGVVASILGFILFNFFFLPPYDTFVIGRPEYVVVLFVNLGLSVTISVLLGRAIERAEAAEERARELRTLQDLSRELVVRGPGSDAYGAIVELIVSRFGYRAGALFAKDLDAAGGLAEIAVIRAEPGAIASGSDPSSRQPAPERLPLSVGSRVVGLLVMTGERPAPSPAESRILRAFGDQLALVLERDRLLRVATEAEVYRQSERLRQTMFAAVSHDLRSPLAAIKASVTDLLDPEVSRSPQDLREALEAIDSETERLNALIANLLDMSRIEAGVLHAKVETVDVSEAIDASVRHVGRVWPGVAVRQRVRAGLLARADRVFLDRVLTNLLDNAARASTGAGDVDVAASRTDGQITIRVADHGRGVPPEARELLFHPFYELDQRNPRLGRGLGLAIAKGYTLAMHGDVWVEETPGGGATLAVAIPASEASA